MIYDETGDIMPTVKALLGITDSEHDTALEMYIEDTITAVLSYCRIDVLPYQLQGLIAQMAAGTYRISGYGSEELPRDVASISEGDRSISFEARGGKNVSADVFADYRSRLEPWVNRKGRVPSDVG